MIWAGIDYGSKLAGTTCIAWMKEGQLKIIQSAKNQDADEWIITQLDNESIDQIFMDAPLSLPPAFHDPLSDEFFYRAADRELKAMSPMFLGGLTARAMRLKKICRLRQRVSLRRLANSSVTVNFNLNLKMRLLP